MIDSDRNVFKWRILNVIFSGMLPNRDIRAISFFRVVKMFFSTFIYEKSVEIIIKMLN